MVAEDKFFAAQHVRVGGSLTYSVCSPLPAETEEPVAAFLRAHPSFEVWPPPQGGVLAPLVADSEALGEGSCVRTWTHRHPADSHFAVRLRRVC